MKRKSIVFILCSVFYVSNAFALTTYKMDAFTAINMRQISSSDGGDYSLLNYVGYNPGFLADRVYGVLPQYGDNMEYSVGFAGTMYSGEQGPSGEADLTIGLYNASGLGISGVYDAFLLPLSNDNDDTWSYQAFVTYNLGEGEVTVDSGSFVDLISDTQTNLLVSTLGLDYSKVVGIGYTIKWLNINNPDYYGGYRTGDAFHTSVIPVPGALLLGLIGVASIRLKLRRFA